MTLICIHDMVADCNSGKLNGYAPEYVVYQLVVCQLVLGTNPDAAENLIMDVPIQSLHQLRSGQACVHFQKC